MHRQTYERLTWEMMQVQVRVIGRAAAWLNAERRVFAKGD
jgi:hypothetical protein